MDYTFDDSIIEAIHKVSAKFDPPYWREIYSKKSFPEEYWNAIASSGLFGILIEKKYGGTEKGLVDLSLATAETAEFYAGIASYLYLSGSLVSKIFTKNSTEDQKRELLPKLAKGKLKISVALTEEKSGFDSSAIESSATRNSAEEFVLRGSKTFVNNVDRADYLILFVRTTPVEKATKKSLGISMFLVDPKNPAIRAKKLEKLGMEFINNFAIEFNDLKVSCDNLIGELDKAWYNIIGIFNMDRIVTSASLVGTGKLALSQASEYASKRNVFGKPIGSNQGIQFPMAEAMAQLLTAEQMTLKAASLADQGENFINESNYALYESAMAASAATDRALQAFGGHGYYKEYDVERYWRDVRVHKIHPISEELLLAAIAERSLGMPKSY